MDCCIYEGEFGFFGVGGCYFCEEEFDFLCEETGTFCDPLVTGTWIEIRDGVYSLLCRGVWESRPLLLLIDLLDDKRDSSAA
jgi:hypothetical protein